MYETFGIRPEDFRSQWSRQHVTLLTITAELQRETKHLHQCSLASTRLVESQINAACKNLTLEVDWLSKSFQEENKDFLKRLLIVWNTKLKILEEQLKAHTESQAYLDRRFADLHKREQKLLEKRRNFIDLPWWTRLLLALRRKDI